jgi:dGTPase
LIEAIAIGHDIGHTPFGHDGEKFLSQLCEKHGIGQYHHNVQSVQFLENVERKGQGWNLCLQTLDGILCHDGEVHNQSLVPARGKDFEEHRRELAAKRAGSSVSLVPMTLEGCVVRFSDTISYIGRDIEDAIRLGLICRKDLPQDCVEYLGNTNGTIVYTLVTDVIRTSYQKDAVALSPEISESLQKLKRFNYDNIYSNPEIKQETPKIKILFGMLFDGFLRDIEKNDLQSPVYKNFIAGMSENYKKKHSPAEIVRDFIAGMTDHYFLNLAPDHMRPSIRQWASGPGDLTDF